MKKSIKIILIVFVFIPAGIVLLMATFKFANDKTEKTSAKNEISNDSLIKKTNTFLAAKDFTSAKENGLELLNKDTSSVKSKELMNTIEKGILNEIEVLETSVPKISKFRTNYDEFNTVTWYHAKSTPSFGNDISIYFGKNDNGELYKLRLVIQYYGDDWIFWKSAKFLVDGETFDYIPMEVKRDNGSGSVWEDSDDQLIDVIKEAIVKISNSKEAKYRLSGKYNYDNTISAKQKTAIKDVLELYEYYEKISELKTLLNQ